MKVVILFNGIHPGPAPMSKRIGLYQKGLAGAGITADILTVFRKPASTIAAYVDPFLIPFEIRRKHGKALREADVVLVDGFNWFTYLLLGFWFGKHTKLVYELNEKPGTVYTTRLLELRPIKALGLFLTRLSLRVFDGIIVISEPLERYTNGIKAGKTQLLRLPIIVDVHEDIASANVEPPAHPYIIHSGALSQQKDGVVDTMKAFGKLNAAIGHTLHFYITGSRNAPPGVWEEIDRTVAEYSLKDNIHFLGFVDEGHLRQLQKHCAFLVLPKPDNEQNRYNFPTKLGEYLVCSRPAIVTAVGEMSRYMIHEQTALVVKDGDVDGIRDAMQRLLDDKALAQRLGEAGHAMAAREFDCTILGARLANFFRSIKQ